MPSQANLTNQNLFDLENAASNKIPAVLSEYLSSHEFPWQALGKTFNSFMKKTIDAIPASERLRGQISPHAILEGSDIVIEEGAVVEAGAYVTGPTIIASGAIVRHAAYVRGSVYACAGSIIGHTTEVKGSVLLPNAKAAHFAYVGDSILGVNTNLGAGTKLANLRLDHGEVKLVTKEGRVSTGLKKFGAILGNESQTGCNSVTNPGTIFLPKILLGPGKVASGVLKKNSL